MAEQKRFYKGDYSATLYIGDDIDNEMAKDFVSTLSQISAQLLETPGSKILVDINSTGGNVYDAFSIINAIKTCPIQVDTYVSGLAASSAFVIALAGKERYCSDLANYMFHSVSATSSGTMAYLQNDVAQTLNLQKMLVDFVRKNSKISKKKLEVIVNANRDSYYMPAECVRMGVVDYIVDVESRR